MKPTTAQSSARPARTLPELIESLKAQIIEYMLEHHNITFLDDTLEKEIYTQLLGLLEPLITSLFV